MKKDTKHIKAITIPISRAVCSLLPMLVRVEVTLVEPLADLLVVLVALLWASLDSPSKPP